jgi:hypothetical protein
MFDRAHVDSTGRTAAGPLNHYSQTETAVWSGGANAAKVALSGPSPGALRLDGWITTLRSGPA